MTAMNYYFKQSTGIMGFSDTLLTIVDFSTHKRIVGGYTSKARYISNLHTLITFTGNFHLFEYVTEYLANDMSLVSGDASKIMKDLIMRYKSMNPDSPKSVIGIVEFLDGEFLFSRFDNDILSVRDDHLSVHPSIPKQLVDFSDSTLLDFTREQQNLYSSSSVPVEQVVSIGGNLEFWHFYSNNGQPTFITRTVGKI